MSLKNMEFSDMDFEQTYMNSNMQRKGVNPMDQLEKMQALNQQYCSNIGMFEHADGVMDMGEPDASGGRDKGPGKDEFDQFFSNTESDALEKFLDNLANPNGLANPMHMYSNQYSNYHHDFPMFDMHTMKPPTLPTPPPQQNSISPAESSMGPRGVLHDSLKKELTESFGHPSMKGLSHDAEATQLPTPLDSRQSSTSYNMMSPPRDRVQDDQDSQFSEESTPHADSPARKRKRSCHKPLLTTEQKRLNHSLSEQKRRQLCKLAYERCLRLVTNINDYTEGSVDATKKKSKRKQINKDGLPNLSKHTALVKISNEMTLIKSQNDGLKNLLNIA